MGFLDRFKPHIDKAMAQAKDPETQTKVKEFARKQQERRRQSVPSGARQFQGGNVGSPGYPFMPGHPMYGTYAAAGMYDDDGYGYDSDGDGIPDSQDSTPYGEDATGPEQVYDPGDQQQYDESAGSPSGSEMGGYDDPQQEVYNDVEDRGSHSEDYGTNDGYSDSNTGSLSNDPSYSDSYSDSGGSDGGGGGGDGY